MEHKEIKQKVCNATTAVIFIHGIAGTPNHFNDFIPYIPDSVSVYNLLLDGHGKGVRDFSHTSMQKWENQICTAVSEIAQTHKQIYIVAHSMGTLFAIEQAIKTSKVKKLFLLAVPIKLFLKPQMLSNSLKVYFNKINPNDQIAVAAKNCYGIEHDKNIFNYIGWIPRYVELFKKIKQTRSILNKLTTPCIAFQSDNDELVAAGSVKYLKANSDISVVNLKNSTHYFYSK